MAAAGETGGIAILSALKQQMRWLGANQQVVSENVANADTPDYKAKVLERHDFSSLVMKVSGEGNRIAPASKAAVLRVTDPRHMQASGTAVGTQISENKKAEVSPTGNSVVLEEEMIKLAENQMQYGLAVNLYKKNAGLLKMAIGRSGS